MLEPVILRTKKQTDVEFQIKQKNLIFEKGV